jgi:hypothetical protein
MTFEQFKYFLGAYGAALERWPAVRRAEAEALLARSSVAAAALGEARRLDDLLDRFVPARDEALERRIAARVAALVHRPAVPARGGSLRPSLGWYWPRMAILAAVALLGVVTGIVVMKQPAVESGWSDYVQNPPDAVPLELAGL